MRLNKLNTQHQDKHCNVNVEAQQLSPGGLDQGQSIKPQPTEVKVLGRNHRTFNSISVISRRRKGEHERLCAMKRRLGLHMYFIQNIKDRNLSIK